MSRLDEEDAAIAARALLRPWTTPAVTVERFADAAVGPQAPADGLSSDQS